MTDSTPRYYPPPVGEVEPYADLLTAPHDGQLLYKIMSVENFLRSIEGHYLHFNRVDSYREGPTADEHDGQQLPNDRRQTEHITFLKAPKSSAADYYDWARSRTYACCFSLENSDTIWRNFGTGTAKGKVCIAFHVDKLRATLNQTLRSDGAAVLYNGERCHQIFSVNYGVIRYLDWETEQATGEYLPHPIVYTFLKDSRFSAEKEFRISLSAFGMGKFALGDGRPMLFPPSLHMSFSFRDAIADGTIQQIECSPDTDTDFLAAELYRLGMKMCDEPDAT